jgi:hypothetical protein
MALVAGHAPATPKLDRHRAEPTLASMFARIKVVVPATPRIVADRFPG